MYAPLLLLLSEWININIDSGANNACRRHTPLCKYDAHFAQIQLRYYCCHSNDIHTKYVYMVNRYYGLLVRRLVTIIPDPAPPQSSTDH